MKIMKERPASGLVVLDISCYFCVSGKESDDTYGTSQEKRVVPCHVRLHLFVPGRAKGSDIQI
jgi:hypothetical protein